MPSLLTHLAEMEKLAERASLDPNEPVHFGLRPLTAFPFATAEAYAELPDVAAAYAEVAAWAFLRKRYRSSKNFDRKTRLTDGYIGAWVAYVRALMANHLRYWMDMGLDEATEQRVTTQHRIQVEKITQAYAVPTPQQCHAIDRIRNAGKMRRGLAPYWHGDRWMENPKAEAIVLTEMGYTQADPRKELSQA